MSFVARTHPQQGPNEKVDNRETTPEVFGPLHERFGFTIDVAADDHNAKLPRYYTRQDDGLAQSWRGERVWCNPPYSNIRPWVEKANSEWDLARGDLFGVELIVMLLPANRTEQAWWQDLIEPTRDQPGGPSVEFIRGRMRFINVGDTEIKPNARPPFGVCLVIWGDLKTSIEESATNNQQEQVQ